MAQILRGAPTQAGQTDDGQPLPAVAQALCGSEGSVLVGRNGNPSSSACEGAVEQVVPGVVIVAEDAQHALGAEAFGHQFRRAILLLTGSAVGDTQDSLRL